MPTRPMRPRKNEGLKQFIPMLYQRPTLRFLKFMEPWEGLADLIFGPPTSRPAPELIVQLRELWLELRDDIIASQQQYAPTKKPWGCRFDKKPAKKPSTLPVANP